MRRFVLRSGAALAVAGASFAFLASGRADEPRALPAPVQAGSETHGAGLHSIVLSGGCFWGVQGVFEHVRGVTKAVAGYSGGPANEATYEQVSTGTTGHAESVQVTYDPSVLPTSKLLQIFFSVALDPTEHNRQGPDEGTQYRSEIFTNDPADASLAHRYIAQLDAAHTFSAPIATGVDPMKGFYPAEHYHQDFLVHNPDYPYIAINDVPKVEALKKLYPDYYSDKPVLALGTGS